MCILNVQRAVHRGLSLGEGVLAKASAVRPRATPQTQKKGTRKQHGHRAHNTHTLRGVRHDTQPHAVTHTFIHSYIHTFIHSYIHTFIHSYIHTFIHSYIHTFIHSYIQKAYVHHA